MALPFIIPAIGTALGAIAGGRGQGREAANDQALRRDQLATQQYQTEQEALLRALGLEEAAGLNRAGLDLQRRQFGLDAPMSRGRNAVEGDRLARATNLQVSHPRANIPQTSGGFGPSDFSPETRQLGREMSRQALLGQLGGDQFEDVPMPDFRGGVLSRPGLSEPARPNAFDKFLGIAAPIAQIGGAIAGGVQESRDRQRQQELIDRILGTSPIQQQIQRIPEIPPMVGPIADDRRHPPPGVQYF